MLCFLWEEIISSYSFGSSVCEFSLLQEVCCKIALKLVFIVWESIVRIYFKMMFSGFRAWLGDHSSIQARVTSSRWKESCDDILLIFFSPVIFPLKTKHFFFPHGANHPQIETDQKTTHCWGLRVKTLHRHDSLHRCWDVNILIELLVPVLACPDTRNLLFWWVHS